MNFGPGNRLEELSGLNGTRIVTEPPQVSTAKAERQESSSDTLDARFDPVTGDLRTLQQSGSFAFTSGPQRASADRAYYSSGSQMAELTGNPKVWDPATQIKADRVLLHFNDDTAEGIGHVRAVHSDQPAGIVRPTEATDAKSIETAQPGRSGSTNDALAGTTNVIADRMFAGRADQFVHYEGHVRAWHAADVIESPSLDYYGRERRLISGSPVLTSHLAPLSGSAAVTSGTRAHAPLSQPVTIRAGQLEYLEASRRAVYRGNVHLQGDDASLNADRMAVLFSEDPRSKELQIDRVIADDHVVLTAPGRRATSEHGTYFAESGKVILQGGPPVLYDEQRGSTTGGSLTFFIHDDSLFVDGGAQSPATSKSRTTR
jgi:lipopolysaccharide export system protein LptA